MMHKLVQLNLVLWLVSMACLVQAQNSGLQKSAILRDVKSVQVEATVVPKPDAVKDPSAANLVQDSLKNALHSASIEVVESAPIHAHLVLDEFTSGSTAKRFMVGFGAGRSAVDCRLVLQDAEGKELSNVRIRVRGNLIFSPYQGNNTQRRQAVNSFDQRLLEEIEKLK
jgi:hypothetical protein